MEDIYTRRRELRYDFYLWVVKTIFYERARRVSKILFDDDDDFIDPSLV